MVGAAFATFTGREGADFAWTRFAEMRFVVDGDFTGWGDFFASSGFSGAAGFDFVDFAGAGFWIALAVTAGFFARSLLATVLFDGFALLPVFFVVARVGVPGSFLVGMSPHIIWRRTVAQ